VGQRRLRLSEEALCEKDACSPVLEILYTEMLSSRREFQFPYYRISG
jgi:hypothetical protein